MGRATELQSRLVRTALLLAQTLQGEPDENDQANGRLPMLSSLERVPGRLCGFASDLQLSAAGLKRGADEYDRTLDLNNPSDAGFDSQHSADRLVATGYNLITRLQTALGPGYKITQILAA